MAWIHWPRRLFRPGGLSTRLLLLTALFVMLGQLLVLAPSMAASTSGPPPDSSPGGR